MSTTSKNPGTNLIVILMRENLPQDKMCEIISQLKKQNERICLVCLSKPYAELMNNLQNEKINCENVIFIDTLSSLHYELKPVSNCIFVPGIDKLNEIKSAIRKAITMKNVTS